MINLERISKLAEKLKKEESREVEALRGSLPRSEYAYFVELLEGGLSQAALAARTGKPIVNLLCVQAPLELIHAAGFLPFKRFSGSYSAASIAAGLPALMCPMLQSLLALMLINAEEGAGIWALPTTCDWIVKFPELLGAKGIRPAVHWVELPHLKETPRGEVLWREAVFQFKKFLEDESGQKIRREVLRDSILVYNRAGEALALLEKQRSKGRVPFVWFLAVTNSFFLDAPERWTEAVMALVRALEAAGDQAAAGADGGAAAAAASAAHPAHDQAAHDQAAGDPQSAASGAAAPDGAAHDQAARDQSARTQTGVFLAGSPVFFPGWKIPRLLEEAGLDVRGDDLCSSGRIFPGAVDLSDESLAGLTMALAERYHHGCICPTFADNDRRINNIFSQTRASGLRAVIYHVLKGCHPCDIESCTLEAQLKANGCRFLRLETGYSAEDSRNLLTRLEAFKQSLEGGLE